MKALINWLDHRTGVRGLVRTALFEHIPGGARWRYVWGSTLVFAFVVQAITGVVLWLAYSPSSQTAWESVYYIQHEMWGGWLVRGIHHYMAQAMIVLLVLHLMQIIIDGAYRAPREVNFWLGMILAMLVLGMSLTGYLLPWDQKGYWATKVATNIAGATPVVGAEVQQVIVGGNDYGHHTLTRFFALHAGIIPGLIIFFILLHVYMFRRHGLTAKRPLKKPDAYFWPDQILRDGVASLAVLAVVVGLTVWQGFKIGFDDPAHLGAHLGAPADPSQEFAAARPEWYFLFLFQLLKLVPLFIGAFIIPGILGALFMAMPITGRLKVGHYFNVAVLFVTIAGAAALTVMALRADADNPDYKHAVAQTEKEAERIIVLAHGQGIPRQGAVTLLQNDPKTRGPKLFDQYCISCHRHGDDDRFITRLGLDAQVQQALTDASLETIAAVRNADLAQIAGLTDEQRKTIETALDAARPTAANLEGFHTAKWLHDFFDPQLIATDRYFGNTNFAESSGMIEYIQKEIPEFYDDDMKAQLDELVKNLTTIAARDLPFELDAVTAEDDKALVARTAELIGDFGLACTDCHKFYGEGSTKGPDLTSHRSRRWIIRLLQDPAHVGYAPRSSATEEATRKYYERYNMPAFGKSQQLDPRSIEILADWLRQNWYEPAAAAPAPGIDGDGSDKPHPVVASGEGDNDGNDGNNKDSASSSTKDAASTDKPAKDDASPKDDASKDAAPKDGDQPKPVTPVTPPTPATPTEVPDAIDFVQHVKPIFEANCVKCHGPTKPKGKFQLFTKELAFKPGSSDEPPIVAGKPDESYLVELIAEPDPDFRMPPGDKGDPLTKVQIDIIRKWIEQGAAWPDGVTLKAPAE